MSSIHTFIQSQLIVIDGKMFRGPYNPEDRASTIHMIIANTSSNNLVFGQVKTVQKVMG